MWCCTPLVLSVLLAQVANPSDSGQDAPAPQKYDRDAPVKPSGFLPLHSVAFSGGLASGAAWLNRPSANQHHFGSWGPAFYLTGGLTILDVVSLSTSLGAVFPADHASFSQDVIPLLGGGTESAESTLQITNYSIEVGPRMPLFALSRSETRDLVVAAFADFGWSAIAGNRLISNCTDCRTEDLELPDGRFVRLGVDLGTIPHNGHLGVTFYLSYQHYLAGAGVTGETRLGMRLWYFGAPRMPSSAAD